MHERLLTLLMLEKRSYPLDLIYVPVKRAKTLDQQKVLTLAEDLRYRGFRGIAWLCR